MLMSKKSELLKYLEGDLKVSDKTIDVFRSYIQDNIILPCVLTGCDFFSWEDFYIFGPGDKKEYDKLKKTRPSYKDIC